MKKLLRNTALIAVFYYLLVLVNACCNCGPLKRNFYKTDDISALNLEFKFEGDTNYTLNQILKDSFEKKSFGIQLRFNSKEIVQKYNTQFGLTNSAYACKCEENLRISQDTLKNFRVRTLQNFDAMHPAGTDVSNLFKNINFQYKPTKLTKISIADFLLEESIWQPYFSAAFYLDQLPEPMNFKVQFEIEAEFKNGKILKDTTPLVTLY